MIVDIYDHRCSDARAGSAITGLRCALRPYGGRTQGWAGVDDVRLCFVSEICF